MTVARFTSTALVLMTGAVVAPRGQGPASDFVPDIVFRGSTLAGWHALGQAQWKAQNGEIVGTAAADAGGWLVSDQAFQDVNLFFRFQCVAPCRAGVLFRVEKGAGTSSGIFVSLAEGDLATYRLTIDEHGREITREPLKPVGPFVRTAGAPAPRSTSAGVGGPPMHLPVPLPALLPPPTGLRDHDWNAISITLDADVIRPVLNQSIDIAAGATDDRAMGYGPVALFAGGPSGVRFKDVAYQDLNRRVVPPETTSSRFRMQRLDDFYYAWGTAAADFNHDGVLDVVAGPYIYYGPAYSTRREIYVASAFNPSSQFTSSMIDYAWDFTGDGWPDVLAGEGRPMSLYVNPKGENRRWMKYSVLPQVNSELALLKDLNGDGQPEVVFGVGTGTPTSVLAYARPDPANPTAPWIVHAISEPGLAHGHGLGVGDINGDGRPDVLQAAGWWEQPPRGSVQATWTYHPEAFGRWGRSEGAGGAEMAVYDVNGDGLNDVVTGLNAHGFGLAWFEQKRDRAGVISFVRHMIIDDFSTRNAGGVTISEMHGAASADLDGDGVPDFITGKRYGSHLDGYTDADPYGLPVLYWFRTARNPKAPGGAEFVPELIHNRSGVGSQFTVVDLNKDGALDIVTATDRGTFIFWGRPHIGARR